MVSGFVLVLMTKNLEQQLNFYLQTIGLELIFQQPGVAGVGKLNQLYIVIKHEDEVNSHHMVENKGPCIISFKCEDDIELTIDKLNKTGIKIRDRIFVPEINSNYVFIEDHDGNEICLDFSVE